MFRGLLLRSLRCLDLTSLEESATAGKIGSLCMKATMPGPGLPSVAAVCVTPNFVRAAARMVHGSGVRVAAVAGGFPQGRASVERRVAEITSAIESGAEEIDTVLDFNAFVDGKRDACLEELAESRKACGDGVTMKVILETASLRDSETIESAAALAMEAGADFVKSSTGFGTGGASHEAAAAMMRAVRAYAEQTGRPVGVKVSGGIRKAADALDYLDLADRELGRAWAGPDRFRIGSSALLDDLVEALAG